jgi:hypothetical protein
MFTGWWLARTMLVAGSYDAVIHVKTGRTSIYSMTHAEIALLAIQCNAVESI